MIVFAGPSVAGAKIPSGIDLRPPAKQGDIYLASLESPEPIGLIDGYFEGVPAVWHKEILWALAHNIPVLGASSMGALRAAELDHFGMIGVGVIYECYRDGLYEDDDEVALHHAPPQVGYAPLSVAMVNIRATISAAVSEGVLTAEHGEQAVDAGKSLFYGDRLWPRVLRDLPESASGAMTAWLPDNEVDQKQRDALGLLDRMARGVVMGASVPHVEPFTFEHTRLWDSAVQQWEQAAKLRKTSGQGVHLLGDDQTQF